MALTRTEIDREYLNRHKLKRFNLMASEDSLTRFRALAESTHVRTGEMLAILLDAYAVSQKPQTSIDTKLQKQLKKAPKLSTLIPKVKQLALF